MSSRVTWLRGRFAPGDGKETVGGFPRYPLDERLDAVICTKDKYRETGPHEFGPQLTRPPSVRGDFRSQSR